MTWVQRSVVVGLVWWMGACAVAREEVRYPIGGKLWPESELKAAYDQVWRAYAIDQGSREIVPAAARHAYLVEGEIIDDASDRRLILLTGSGYLAVQCRDRVVWEAGERISLVVRPSGTATYSHELEPDDRRSLPQVVDVTLTFEEFVTSLQRGRVYPELPQFGTRDGRKGGFRTERVHRNKLVDP